MPKIWNYLFVSSAHIDKIIRGNITCNLFYKLLVYIWIVFVSKGKGLRKSRVPYDTRYFRGPFAFSANTALVTFADLSLFRQIRHSLLSQTFPFFGKYGTRYFRRPFPFSANTVLVTFANLSLFQQIRHSLLSQTFPFFGKYFPNKPQANEINSVLLLGILRIFKGCLLLFLAPMAVGQRAYVMVCCPSCVRTSVRALTFSLNVFFSETTYRILMKFHRNVSAMVLFRIS